VFQTVPNPLKNSQKTANKRPKSVPNCSTLKYISANNQQLSSVNYFYTLYIFWNSYSAKKQTPLSFSESGVLV
jgi:hypothetical protein